MTTINKILGINYDNEQVKILNISKIPLSQTIQQKC